LAFFDDAVSGARVQVAPSWRPGPTANDTEWVRSDGSRARRARGHLVALSVLTMTCALAGLIDATTSAVRWSGGTMTLTLTEIVLAVLGSIALSIAPAIAWGRFVSERAWPSTPRAITAGARLRRILSASLLAYGVTSLSVRVLEGVVRADARDESWPGWSLLCFVSAVAFGTSVWFSDALRDRARLARIQSSSR
ncbi:MAG TPA: hypothetical protein VHZ95_09360, partial [Polyangiales bacterium]|nr:hypothetical protein [Polyangiales bacterium]